jgi:hypothetical protein
VGSRPLLRNYSIAKGLAMPSFLMRTACIPSAMKFHTDNDRVLAHFPTKGEIILKYPLYEYIIMAIPIAIGIVGGYFLLKRDWKRYGLVFLLNAIAGNALCYGFVLFGFYSFPNTPLHYGLPFPLLVMLTFIPFTSLLGIQFSPEKWAWKIPFYWPIVHLAIVGEILVVAYTEIIRYKNWDLWDSYTSWWVFYLFFEWIGGKIIPAHLRTPLSTKHFRYGRWGWLLLHIILILSVLVIGIFIGKTLP